MKNLILAFLVSIPTLASAQMIIPRVSGWGTSAQVQIQNPTQQTVWCSGSLNMSTRSGRVQTEFVSAHLFPYGSFYQNYYLRDPQDSITYVSHSIWCN